MNAVCNNRALVLTRIYDVDVRHLFSDLYACEPAEVKLEMFDSRAHSYVRWSEVKRREVTFIGMHLGDAKPLLRVNLALLAPMVPHWVIWATLLEEYIHLYLGWDKPQPHDDEFYQMALKCPFFGYAMMWKDFNVLRVIGEVQGMTPEGIVRKRMNSTVDIEPFGIGEPSEN